MYLGVVKDWRKCFVVFVASVFVLSARSCHACDDDCRVTVVEENEGSLSFVGEHRGIYGTFWIKMEPGFSKLVFQLKIDVQFDFLGDIVYNRLLNITKEQFLDAVSKENQTEWHQVQLKVFKKEVQLALDPYILEAHIGTNHFEMTTALWWRLNTIKAIQLLIEGDAQVSFECHPCEPTPAVEEDLSLQETSSNATALHSTKLPSIVEHVHESNPVLIILLGINIVLFIFIALFIISIRVIKKSKDKMSLVDQTNPMYPYLHGNYVREENLYDEVKVPVVKVLNCPPPLPQSSPPTNLNTSSNNPHHQGQPPTGGETPPTEWATSYSNPSYNSGPSNRTTLSAAEKASPGEPEPTASSGRLSFRPSSHDGDTPHQGEDSSYA